MRLLRTLVFGAVLLVGGWAVVAFGQSVDDVRSHPGYVDLQSVESWFSTAPSIQVDIDGPLLDLVAQSVQESDAEFSQMVRGLRAIQVRGYPMQGANAAAISSRTQRLADSLQANGWRRVLYVRDGAEVARIFLRPDPSGGPDRIAGLTVLAIDPADEAVLVNVVGPLEPDQIRRLGASLNVESLESVGPQ